MRLRTGAMDIDGMVASMTWYGADADGFREQCSLTVRRIEALGDRLSALEGELDRHAEEQDAASESDGAGLSALFGGPLGVLTGGLLGLLGGLSGGAGPTSSFLGMGGGPAGLLAGLAGGGFDTTGLTNEMGTPIDPEIFEPKKDSSVTGSGSVKTGDTTHTGSVTEHDDGSISYGYEVSEKNTLKVGSEAAGGSATLTTGEKASVTEHPDGSLTVTFEAEVTGGAEVHGEVRGVEGGIESEVTGSGSFSVTLPPGSSPDDALGVHPYDPDTIPPGAEVTTTGELSGSVAASLGYKDAASASFGVSGGEEQVSTIARGMDGTLTVDQGPGSTQGINAGLKIGPDEAQFDAEAGTVWKTTDLEHTEFAATPEGRAAFDAYIFTGKQPDAGSPGVDEAYVDTVKTEIDENSFKASIGDGDGTGTSMGASSEVATVTEVKRTYSDDSWVKESRYSPSSEGGYDGGGTYGVTHENSDGETRYELRYFQDGSAPPTSYNEMYGNAPYTVGKDQTVNVQLTEAEMDQLIENRGKDESPEEVLNAYAVEGAEGARRMAEDYAEVGPGQGGAAPGVVTEPGAGIDPAQRGGGSGTGSPGSTRATPSAR